MVAQRYGAHCLVGGLWIQAMLGPVCCVLDPVCCVLDGSQLAKLKKSMFLNLDMPLLLNGYSRGNWSRTFNYCTSKIYNSDELMVRVFCQ